MFDPNPTRYNEYRQPGIVPSVVELPRTNDSKVLRDFLTPEVIRARLLYCEDIDPDHSEHLLRQSPSVGGFIFIQASTGSFTSDCQNEAWEYGILDGETQVGRHLMRAICSIGFFPQDRFTIERISPRTTPERFSTLLEALEISIFDLEQVHIKDPLSELLNPPEDGEIPKEPGFD